MRSIVPDEVLREAQTTATCRQKQLQQLAVYYNNYLPHPPVLVAHGLKHTGKLETITALLQANSVKHAIVTSRECLSQRHLFTKIFTTCARRLERLGDVDKYDRIDNLSSLVVNLQRLLATQAEKMILIIDGIDRQRGTSQTLLPALARLGDLVHNLSLILISSSSRPLALHRPGVPYIHFAPYSRAESIAMVIMTQPILLPQNLSDTLLSLSQSQMSAIYKSFVTTVYDTLTSHTSSVSLRQFRQTCERLWPRFIWPTLSGEAPPIRNSYTPSSSNATWDFARLLVKGRSLFQQHGEKALLPRLVADPQEISTFEELLSNHQKDCNELQHKTVASESKQTNAMLKLFSTLVLVSSYLASHTPPKHDIILFSRLSSSSTNKRKYLTSALSKSRSGGVRKTPTKKRTAEADRTAGDETPSKKRKTTEENGEGLAGEKTPKSTRLLLEKTSSIPRPFAFERVIAILRTIHPEGLPRTKAAAEKVYAEMAELERLRLVVRCAGDGTSEDNWKINVSRSFVVAMGRRWSVSLDGWEID